MKVYLAQVATHYKQCLPWLAEKKGAYSSWGDSKEVQAIRSYKPFVLDSFAYHSCFGDRFNAIFPACRDFILDSGAFTFIRGKPEGVDWTAYIERYAEFIRRGNIKYFIELDIDNLVGHKRVVEYRRYLESLTNAQPIPVWHRGRGIPEFLRLCDEYPYVAIGGIAIREILPREYKAFPSMIREAHKRGAKVHGLGFTNISKLRSIHFDSVDSTAWLSGSQFGHIYQFKNGTLLKYSAPEGMRLKNPARIEIINYIEWLKFQRYAETNL